MPDAQQKRIGRPRKYTQQTGDKVLEYLAKARPLSWIERQPGMPSTKTILAWMDPQSTTFVDGFLQRYARARETAADHLASEALAIADDPTGDYITRYHAKSDTMVVVPDYENVQRSRLRVDTRKWAAAKFAPHKYGDKVIQEVTGANGGPVQSQSIVVDIIAGLDEIRDRMRKNVAWGEGRVEAVPAIAQPSPAA